MFIDVILKVVGKIMALSILPAQHIKSMFFKIESLVLPNGNMCEFVNYVCQPWIEHPVFVPTVGQCTTPQSVSDIIG